MITIPSMTHNIDTHTIQKYLLLLGTATACLLLLALLWLTVWVVQEVVLALSELFHLIGSANPILVSALLVLAAVWLIGKIKR
jgi:hypothetical protein